MKTIGAFILIGFLTLTLTSAFTERPATDEGSFADPGLNLYRNGSMGSLFLPDHKLKGIHERTYWIHPLHIVAQAGWYRLFGFSIVTMRGLSILFGLAAIFAWFVIAKNLFKDNGRAATIAVLVAADYYFLVASAWGRMDMMTASLGFCGYAFYLAFRENSLPLAIVGSHTFIVLSGLTHPMGVLHLAALLVLTVGLDRRKLRLAHLALAGVPYVIGAAAWGAYILQSPSDFMSQYQVNAGAGDRFRSLREPWKALWWEIHDRYLLAFGISAGRGGPVHLKSIILLAYIVGFCGAWLSPRLRAKPAFRILMAAWAAMFLIVTFLDGVKEYHYLTHSTPFLAAFCGLWICDLWAERRVPRPVVALGVAGLMLVQISGLVYRAYLNTNANAYLPACKFIRDQAKPGDRIFSTPAMLFGLDFRPGFHADSTLGFHSKVEPDYIVVEAESRADTDRLMRTDSSAGRHVKRILLNESRVIYDRFQFQVYRRLPKERPAGSQ